MGHAKQKLNRRKSRQHNTLDFRKLEQRQLLAGDVAAFSQGGTLYLRGDDAANRIDIQQVASGIFEVRQTPGFQNDPSSINGSTTSVRFSNVRQIDAAFGNGNDIFRLTTDFSKTNSFTPLASLKIGMDVGKDEVVIANTNIVDARIYGGKGADKINVNSGRGMIQSLLVDAGDGNNNIDFGGAFFNVKIDTGMGNDRIYGGLLQLDNLTVNTNEGNDECEFGFVSGLASSRINSLEIRLGEGDDVCRYTLINGPTCIKSLFYRGGSGFDTLERFRSGTGLIDALDQKGFEFLQAHS